MRDDLEGVDVSMSARCGFRNSATRKSRWRPLRLEQLEDRSLMAADALAGGAAIEPSIAAITQENFPEIWKATFGSFVDLRADANRNGFVDAADYNVWRDGKFDPHPPLPADPPPQVVDVIISGSRSSHAPYSFAAVAGSGEQLRTVPVGGADTITIVFSEDVNIVPIDLRVVGLQTAFPPKLIDAHYDLARHAMVWRFETLVGTFGDDGYQFGEYFQLALSDYVTDVGGNRLDGEWVNPGSLATNNPLLRQFPTGDGYPGGSFRFIFTLLPGDANRDLRFDELDLQIAIANQSRGLTNATFAQGDFNGDGLVTGADLRSSAPNWGTEFGVVTALGDLNGDRIVDGRDGKILDDNKWVYQLEHPTVADGDLNRNGVIEIGDLDLMAAQLWVRLNIVL